MSFFMLLSSPDSTHFHVARSGESLKNGLAGEEITRNALEGAAILVPGDDLVHEEPPDRRKWLSI
jgi:hypothetical protein